VRADTAAAPPELLIITEATASGYPIRWSLPHDLERVEHIGIHSSEHLVVIGDLRNGDKVLIPVDVARGLGRVRSCTDVRALSPERYLCHEKSGDLTYDAETDKWSAAAASIDRIVAQLRGGNLSEAKLALKTIGADPILQQNEDLRAALVATLARQIEWDARTAAHRRGSPTLADMQNQELMDLVLRRITPLRIGGAAELIAKADSWSMDIALAAYGRDAMQAALDALERPEPPGYSPYYRAHLITAVQVILRQHPELRRSERNVIGHALVLVFSGVESAPTLEAALRLAELIDVAELDPFIEDIAAGRLDRYQIADRAAANAVQRLAHELLERRITIR
jgi:hypothetical protein